MVNVTLWIVQIFLALFFLASATPKISGRGLQQWTGFSDLPRSLILGIGAAEFLGSAGLVLPMATGVLPWLTPLAAIGLAVNVLMATGFHVRGAEWLNAVETTLWATIAAIIAIGRWNLMPRADAIPQAALVVALAVLLPSAIINVIVLLRPSLRHRSVTTRES